MRPPLGGSQAERVSRAAADAVPYGAPYSLARYSSWPPSWDAGLPPLVSDPDPLSYLETSAPSEGQASESCSSVLWQLDESKKGAWSADEDLMLMQYVKQHGSKNWASIQSKMPGFKRCGKSCRLRWVNHLRGGLKKTAMSTEEERRLLEMHDMYGNKWAKIAAGLPGRTDNEVKNWYNGRQKRLQRTKHLAAQSAALPSLARTHPSNMWTAPPSFAAAPPPWSTWSCGPSSCGLPYAHTPLQGSSSGSSAGSSFVDNSGPAGGVQPWGNATPPYRKFHLPPLLIPEVAPEEEERFDRAPTSPEIAPLLAGAAAAAADAALFPPFSSTQPRERARYPWEGSGVAAPRGFAAATKNALSPLPRPPQLTNADSYFVDAQSFDGSRYFPPVAKRESGVLPYDRWGGRDDAAAGLDAGGKRCNWRDESEGECESEVTSDRPHGEGPYYEAPSLALPPLSTGGCSWPAWLDEASPWHRLEVEAAAASLYPTATAFLATFQPDAWGLMSPLGDGTPTPRTNLPPLASLEELGTCVGESPQGDRMHKIASWSNFLCNGGAGV